MRATTKPTGIVRGKLYTQEAFRAAMGWGRPAFKKARERGLPVRKVSFRLYVSGDEAIDWLLAQPTAMAPASS